MKTILKDWLRWWRQRQLAPRRRREASKPFHPMVEPLERRQLLAISLLSSVLASEPMCEDAICSPPPEVSAATAGETQPPVALADSQVDTTLHAQAEFVIPEWMTQEEVEYTSRDTPTGTTYDVYIEDLDYEFYTPSTWVWAPACFDQPLVDLAGLPTGYEAGWSFTIDRSDAGAVSVYNVGYELRTELLDYTVLDVKMSRGSGTIFGGSYDVTFQATLDEDLEWQNLGASVSLDLDVSKDIPLGTIPAVGVPGIGSIDFGLSGNLQLGFEAQVTPTIDPLGNFSITSASFDPHASIGLTGFGELNALTGLLKGGARISGALTQDFNADYAGGSWTYSAPGSLDVVGQLYYSYLWGLDGDAYDLFTWEVASWDFIDGGSAPAPPTAYNPYAPPGVFINGDFSTDPSNPTKINNSFFAVTATANDPVSIRDRGYEFATWSKSGSDWTSKANWGPCNGADTVGSFADGVYMIQVSAINNNGEVGYSDAYYFEIDAEPSPGSDLAIYGVGSSDEGISSDRDGVIEGWEKGEYTIAIESDADVEGVEAYLVSAVDAVEFVNDYNWYGDIHAGNHDWGAYEYRMKLNFPSYSNLPLTLRVTYRKDGTPYLQDLPLTVDVHPQADYGGFEVLDYLIDDSTDVSPVNNGDGIFQSGERVEIRPLIKYLDDPIAARATSIDLSLFESDDLSVFANERRYPGLDPGESAYPEDGKTFTVQAAQGYAGSPGVDVAIEWNQRSRPLTFPGALEFNVQPAPWLRLDEEEWDFGVAHPGELVTHMLSVMNTGSDVLHVTDITTSHADTTVDIEAFSLNPGESQDVVVSIDTSVPPNGMRISRDIHVLSDGRTPEPQEDEHLVITGLVSNQVPIFAVPSPEGSSRPDISGDWVVWDEVRDGNWDIFAYNVVTGEERRITDDPAGQGSPRIAGDLIAWNDYRNAGSTSQSDVYGYDLSTGLEFPISTDPLDEWVTGIDGGKVAFTRVYHEFTEPADTPYVANLWLYDHDTGSTSNLTGFTSNTTHEPMDSVIRWNDFGDGRLLWKEDTMYWAGTYWGISDRRINTMEIGGPIHTISEADGWSSDLGAVDGDRIVWSDEDANRDCQVWLWGNGSVQPIVRLQNLLDKWVPLAVDRVLIEKAPGSSG